VQISVARDHVDGSNIRVKHWTFGIDVDVKKALRAVYIYPLRDT
jgi:hypothetical protein